MNVAIPVAFFMSQAAKNQRAKLLYIVLLGLFILSVVASSSRGAFLGLVAVAVYCWFYSSKKIISLFWGICLIGLVLIAAPQEYWDRINSITDDSTMESGTAGQRMFTWGIGWEMFLANPVFGVGQGNFPWTIGDYLGTRTWQTKSLAGRQAHSLYFTLLPELGLVGVMIFGAMIYSNYKDTRVKQFTAHRSRVSKATGFKVEADRQLYCPPARQRHLGRHDRLPCDQHFHINTLLSHLLDHDGAGRGPPEYNSGI